eukprot:g5322.t1
MAQVVDRLVLSADTSPTALLSFRPLGGSPPSLAANSSAVLVHTLRRLYGEVRDEGNERNEDIEQVEREEKKREEGVEAIINHGASSFVHSTQGVISLKKKAEQFQEECNAAAWDVVMACQRLVNVRAQARRRRKFLRIANIASKAAMLTVSLRHLLREAMIAAAEQDDFPRAVQNLRNADDILAALIDVLACDAPFRQNRVVLSMHRSIKRTADAVFHAATAGVIAWANQLEAAASEAGSDLVRDYCDAAEAQSLSVSFLTPALVRLQSHESGVPTTLLSVAFSLDRVQRARAIYRERRMPALHISCSDNNSMQLMAAIRTLCFHMSVEDAVCTATRGRLFCRGELRSMWHDNLRLIVNRYDAVFHETPSTVLRLRRVMRGIDILSSKSWRFIERREGVLHEVLHSKERADKFVALVGRNLASHIDEILPKVAINSTVLQSTEGMLSAQALGMLRSLGLDMLCSDNLGFSEAVPLICSAVICAKDRIMAYFFFEINRHEGKGQGDEAARRRETLDAGKTVVGHAFSHVCDVMAARVSELRGDYDSMLGLRCIYLDCHYLVIACRKILPESSATLRLNSVASDAADAILQIQCKAIDLLLENCTELNFLEGELLQAPRPYVSKLLDSIQEGLEKQHGVHDYLHENLIMEHLAQELRDMLRNAPRVNSIAIANLRTDVRAMVRFADRRSVPNLAHKFSTLRALLDMLLVPDLEATLFDVKAPCPRPMLEDLRIILKHFHDGTATGFFSSLVMQAVRKKNPSGGASRIEDGGAGAGAGTGRRMMVGNRRRKHSITTLSRATASRIAKRIKRELL